MKHEYSLSLSVGITHTVFSHIRRQFDEYKSSIASSSTAFFFVIEDVDEDIDDSFRNNNSVKDARIFDLSIPVLKILI